MKKAVNIILLFAFVLIYLFFASNFNFYFPTSKYNYHNLLSESFLKGKVYLISQPYQLLDLSYFKDKLYLYFPPVPAILLIPFMLITKNSISDIFFTSLIGGLSCFIFFLVLKEFKKTKIILISNKSVLLLSLVFALGSNHFYLSLFGQVWWTSHIIAVMFLNLSLLFLFKFLNSKKSLLILVSSLFLTLASLSRFPLIFAFFFSFFLLLKNYYLKNPKTLKNFSYFLAPPLLIFPFFLYYNYIRFQSIFELGYKYQIYAPILDFNAKNFGRFNLVYLPFNLYYYLLHPFKLISSFPFYKPYHNGTSIFLVFPLSLLIFLNQKKAVKKIKKAYMFFISLIITIVLIFLPALLNFSPGGPQIASRFSLDFLPFYLLLLSFFTEDFKSKKSLFLFFLSLYFGLTSFYIVKFNLFEF
jgi:hypothetical protein